MRDSAFINRRQGLALAAAALAGPAFAQGEPAFPTKPMRIVVPYPPGGFNDTLGRLVARKFSEAWGQSVVVDNRAGAGTTLGTQNVAQAAPDGHTLLVVQFPFAANPWMYKTLPYDTQKAFAPVLLAGRAPMVLVVNAASPHRSVADVLAAAKARPGQLNYGSSGSGSSNHLAMALFESVTGTQMNQVPYKGSTPMLTDLAGGQVELAFDLLPHVLPFLQSGKVRALALAGAQRWPTMPDLPTVAEAGVKDFVVTSWHGIVAPAGTPAPVLTKLNAQLNLILQQDDVKKAFAAQGVAPDGGTPQRFAAFIDEQLALWKRVIQTRGISAD